MKTEAKVQEEVRDIVSQKYPTVRLWRNNVGSLKDRNGRWVQFGLCEFSSDLIGFESIIVTQEMVGTRVAIFLACEVKKANGRLSKGQKDYIDLVNGFGGKAFDLYDSEEIQTFLAQQPRR